MNIAIVGYGKMGKEIERVLREKKILVSATIDKFAEGVMFKNLDKESLKNIDVAVDFSSPESAIKNINKYVENKVSVVMGTTGWYNEIDKVKKMVGDEIGFIWSGDFSLGVNIFFRIVKESARIFNKFEEYDPLAYEIHHSQKADSPSGTAKMIGKILLNEIGRKENLAEDKLDRKINKNEIHFASVRGGNVPGTHVVMFDSDADTIELKHTARNRCGMAQGAVLACKWIFDKKGFYSIEDLMDSII